MVKLLWGALNAWNSITFRRIGEMWGSFILMDDNTMTDESFKIGKVLIATEEAERIDVTIKMEVQGQCYDVRIKEGFSCIHPDEVCSGLGEFLAW